LESVPAVYPGQKKHPLFLKTAKETSPLFPVLGSFVKKMAASDFFSPPSIFYLFLPG